LSVRDWIYSLSVLVPLILYNVLVKLQHIDQLETTGWWDRVALLRSSFLFSLAFSLCWIGLLSMARRGPWRWATLVLLQVAALCYVVIVVAAHQYFEVTGASLDYDLVALGLTDFTELRPVLASEVSLGAFAVVCAYVLFAPGLMAFVADRLRLLPDRGASESGSRLGLLLLPAAFGVALLSLIPAASPLGISFSRDPMLQVLITAAERSVDVEAASSADIATGPVNAFLVARPGREPKNLVLVILESTGASSVTPYNGAMPTTPYLDELAKSSLVVERAYSTIPHTSKALVSIVCGIEPRPIRPIAEALPGLIPSICLPDLLEPHGYRSVFFQPASEFFQDRRQLVENFGFQDFFPGESMRTRGFERANYFGFEDDIMLRPSRRWLESHRGEPFFATYLTVTPHHQYLAPTRYGRVAFTERETYNLYLNAVRYQDFFLKNLIAQYQELGLYDKTVFVIVGDHGEAFGEHRRSKHDDVLYEEVMRVPFLVHAPVLEAPRRVAGPASLLDIVPSAADLLGFEVTQGAYPGRSVLSLPAERSLFFTCFHENRCLGRLSGWEKFIYHYDNQPDELFDLSNDPQETTNLADTIVDVERRRGELRQWRASLDGTYRRYHRDQIEPSVLESRPLVENSLNVVFHDSLALIGYDLSRREVRRGESFRITYYFHVLEQLPPTWRLVVQAQPGEGASGGEGETLAPSPLQRLYRLRFWQPGRFVADTHDVSVPEDWSSSSFVIAMGFFNTRRDQMVRVTPRTSAEDELVTVARLTVLK
jgi:phosphoglycerol transferase MdoB-like AlkP superfamily enzyme